MPKKIGKKGKMFVHITAKNSEPKQYEQTLEPAIQFKTPVAEVYASSGFTISRDYNSVRVDCGLTLPCYVDDIGTAYTTAWELVEQELTKQVPGLIKSLKELSQD